MKFDSELITGRIRILFLVLDYPSHYYKQLFALGPKSSWLNDAHVSFIRYTGKIYNEFIFRAINRLEASTYGIAIRKIVVKSPTTSGIKKRIINVEQDMIKIDVWDTWWNHTEKTRLAIKYCVENLEFDYIVRVNSSAYVNFEALEDFLLRSKPKYGGPKEKGKPFTSGWGIILNKEVASVLAEEQSWQTTAIYDDEAIGLVLKSKGILPSYTPHLWLKSIESLDQLSSEELKRYPLIRTKSYDSNGNRIDFEIMSTLHSKLKGRDPKQGYC